MRLAEDTDAGRIKELFEVSHGTIKGMDWSSIYPYWIAEERDGRIVGCINIAPSKPIGRLDFLCLDPGLGPHARGRVMRALTLQGLGTLKAQGCGASVSEVPFELKAYKKLLKKHFRATVVGQGNMVVRTL